ncbi:hypothetical protein COW36_03850 [bacterium (Candidatus Blackallbacteria) CG17_big_fil_post_rev_8_21_14_2_50_48_46]|uniref:Outer membrane protein beta-barrel domain-containing protein n=1 Tax=bacterium (Candidatus Blackallbacteria) CG17_big_fil_post_rev_8_21_14_2_50_48_46 TaxID=2014261 RepID=A0A2M7G8J7_9BACT|nr:MAG: hypothetical protein COW64_05095 [bacterium (Candidatus Blackallbacteria) CG18_big_fil_WC_8_21_14_2_50_49_26]PIW18433.1 MAG: hypothetical protein COW36_03850 [bacterium (Candidatus Blackallbacteria) CG17_big_fil_post_rev_8_21_14_2_50_48_46]PIW46582.1 MAG: hypothetical protein COW20_16830 [bacterium (Candidatus Blackallbacteria) CG13_big_fil_rev_8_21_14_2_50_49_14]
MKKRSKIIGLSFALLMASSFGLQAQALTFTYSDKTQRVAPYFDFRGDYDLPFNLNIAGSLGFTNDLSSFVSPLSPGSGNAAGSDLLSQALSQIKWDALTDLQLNLGYNFNFVNLDLGIGKVAATVTPYLGYRHMFTSTGSLSASPTNSQLMGVNYGARLKIGLPLGFSGYGYLAASSLLSGSLDQGSGGTPIQTNGMVLPEFGAGAAWHLPILDLASIYLGYRGFFLPNDLRLSSSFTNGSSLVHGVSAGVNVLFFGI